MTYFFFFGYHIDWSWMLLIWVPSSHLSSVILLTDVVSGGIWGFLSLVSMWEGLELQTSEWAECRNSDMVIRIMTLYWTWPVNRTLVFPGTSSFVLVKLLCYRWDGGLGGWSKLPLPLLTASPKDHSSFPVCSVRTMYHLLCRAHPPSLPLCPAGEASQLEDGG